MLTVTRSSIKCDKMTELCVVYLFIHYFLFFSLISRSPVAHWVKRWPTDLADRDRSPLEAKTSQP